MPYTRILAMGEVLRRSVMGPPEPRRTVELLTLLCASTQYSIFASIYWYWMLRRAHGKPICHEVRRDIPATEIPWGDPPQSQSATGGSRQALESDSVALATKRRKP